MSKSCKPDRNGARGFSLLEVLIATSVLVIGVCAMAALSATMLTRGRQSKYMSMAGTLASEKLEDLNRWQSSFSSAGVDQSDPQICVNAGSTSEGSLTADTSTTIACNGITETVNYFDDVSIDMSNSTDCPNPTDGCFAESTSTMSGGTTTYSTTFHSPDGTIPGFPAGTALGTGPGYPVQSSTPPNNMIFHRRWIIEANPNGVSGVRRITVLVTLQNQATVLTTSQPQSVSGSGVKFQMSVVRP